MKKALGIFLMIAAAAVALLIGFTNTSQSGSQELVSNMDSAGAGISAIKPSGGAAADEAFYTNYGKYLQNEAVMQQKTQEINEAMAWIFKYIGWLLCAACFVQGALLIMQAEKPDPFLLFTPTSDRID